MIQENGTSNRFNHFYCRWVVLHYKGMRNKHMKIIILRKSLSVLFKTNFDIYLYHFLFFCNLIKFYYAVKIQFALYFISTYQIIISFSCSKQLTANVYLLTKLYILTITSNYIMLKIALHVQVLMVENKNYMDYSLKHNILLILCFNNFH